MAWNLLIINIDSMHTLPISDQPRESGTIFTIGEAADLLGVSVPTLRAYEHHGLIIPLRGSTRQHRHYRADDLERLRCIRRMIQVEKVSIAGMRRLLALIPCWKIKDCPPQDRESCPAFLEHDAPCWAKTRRAGVCKNPQCRTCPVYSNSADCSTLKSTIAHYTL